MKNELRPTTTIGDLCVFLQSSIQQWELLCCCQPDGSSLSWAIYWEISCHGSQAAAEVQTLFRWLAPPSWSLIGSHQPHTQKWHWVSLVMAAGLSVVSRKSVPFLGWGGGQEFDETKQRVRQTLLEEIQQAGWLRYLVMWLQSNRCPGSGCVSVCCYVSEGCGERRHVLQEVKVRMGESGGREGAWPGGGMQFVSF